MINACPQALFDWPYYKEVPMIRAIRPTSLLLLSLATLCAAASNASAATFTFRQGVNGYVGVVDTDADWRFPGAHNGETIIRASANAGDPDVQILIRFEDI